MVKNLGPHLVPNAKIFGSGLVPGTENSLVPAQILGPESLKAVQNLGLRLVPKAKIFGPGLVPKTRLGTKGPKKKHWYTSHQFSQRIHWSFIFLHFLQQDVSL